MYSSCCPKNEQALDAAAKFIFHFRQRKEFELLFNQLTNDDSRPLLFTITDVEMSSYCNVYNDHGYRITQIIPWIVK